jgi:hypothetical protein
MYALIPFCLLSIKCFSQHPGELSAEYQHGFGKNYNENSIGLRYEGYDNNNIRNTNNSNRGSWSLGVCYAFSSLRNGDKTAKGNGFGIFAGYRYGLKYGITGDPYAGIRTSFIFGKDKSGKTYSLFTPSLELGYHYTSQDFNKGGAFTSFAAIGYDIKMKAAEKTEGLHEGFIFSPGISFGWRF